MIPSALLPHTVTVTPRLGEAAGGPTFGEPVEHRGRVAPGRRWTPGNGMEAGTREAVAIMRPDAAVADGDRLEYDGIVYRVLAVHEVLAGVRVHHLAVNLGRWEQ